MPNCNEVQSASVNIDYNIERMNEIKKYWSSKKNIRRRYTNKEGIYLEEVSWDGLKSWVWDITSFPFVPEQNFTNKQLNRIKKSIDDYDKDAGGKFKNIAGIAAVPRGYARLDPTSNKFYNTLEQAKNFERNTISKVETNLQDIRDQILKAHIEVGKGSKWFGNRSYKDFRKIRDKVMKAKDQNMETDVHTAIESFFKSDNGKLLNEYRQLVKLRSKKLRDENKKLIDSELDIAVKDGYIDPITLKNVKYNKTVVDAVRQSHALLDDVGNVNILALKRIKSVIGLKFSRFNPKYRDLNSKIDQAIDRINKGIEIGDYFPKIALESMHEMKSKINDLIMESNMGNANNKLEELISISDKIVSDLGQLPRNTRAANKNLNLLWDSDPYVIMEKYSRDAIQFNRNAHIQESYLQALREIPNLNNDFIKGMKSFIMEEFLVSTADGRVRDEWVNETVRVFNGFQTGRTMGLNVTGGIKNAASILHYLTKVGKKSIINAQKAYRGDLKKIVDKVEAEEGFLFNPADSTTIMEGLVGKDRYNRSHLKFDEIKGDWVYKETPVKDLIDISTDKTLGFLLTFHRWTENSQRRFMFRTSFIDRYSELKATGDHSDADLIRFSRNHALRMVNGWAYEYAPFAKSKYVRGDGVIVDEIGETYIVKSPVKSMMQQITFHLLHYPMSLLETHISELKGAKQSIKAAQWDSPELQYLMRYGGASALLGLTSVAVNANLFNIFENETVNRIARIRKDIMEYDNDERATFGLLSEFTGPTIGHLKYAMIMSGLLQLDTPTQKIIFGNVDYTNDSEESRRYTDYQYSTEYGRLRHKILPAIRDGRGVDLFRHYLNFYPAPWIKEARRKIGLKKNKSSYSREDALNALRLLG